MSHPLLPQILQTAEVAAAALEMEVVGVYFYTHKNPAVIRVDIRNLKQHTGLDDCESMSRLLEEALDREELIPHAYVLEISSPGTARVLESDREFVAFRGFTVTVNCNSPYDGKEVWTGQLVNRTEDCLILTQKGKPLSIPLSLVFKVELV